MPDEAKPGVTGRETVRYRVRSQRRGSPHRCEWAQMAREGCLLGYGASFDDLVRHTGQYVAQILRGTSLAELPIEHPSRLEFAVNLNTARALKLDLPPVLLLRADEVIE